MMTINIDYKNGNINKLATSDRAVHDWYRFVLSYPAHLVQDYIEDFNLNRKTVLLDPFCGTGTTLVEAKLRGIPSVGLEANTIPYLASKVKTKLDIDPVQLHKESKKVASRARTLLSAQGINDDIFYNGDITKLELRDLTQEEHKLILTNSISPLPLHKTLVLLDCLRANAKSAVYEHQLVALATTIVNVASNLRFGPEVGVGKAKFDSSVIGAWMDAIENMARDIESLDQAKLAESQVHLADARQIGSVLKPDSIDAIITSPPYPNEKDYTRITRLESVILGYIRTKEELRQLKKGLVRSNTRNVYKGDDDDTWVKDHAEIQEIANLIEKRRIDLGKTSGFEKLYGKVTKLYFGGMARHLAELRPLLRRKAQLAYVVGDQASYLQVMIRTGELIGEIAQVLGYELVRIDLFRTRLATATKQQLREEVVILRYKG
jgi:DNA modification methylase